MGMFMLILDIVLAGLGIISLFAKSYAPGIIFLVIAFLVLFGFRVVRQEERFVIELFGKYQMTLKPGLHWIWPWIQTVRAIVPIWIQEIPLFQKETAIKIDFKDGSATPVGAIAQVRVYKPEEVYLDADGKSWPGIYRTIYIVGNWQEVARNLLENAIRAYLNMLTIDIGLTMKGSGIDLKNRIPKDEVEKINKALERIGIELLQATIRDFALEEALVSARGAVQIAIRRAKAAVPEAEARSQESAGALVAMLAAMTGRTPKQVKEEIDNDKDLKEQLIKFAQEMVSRQASLQRGVLQDIRVGGADGLQGQLLQLIALLKGKP